MAQSAIVTYGVSYCILAGAVVTFNSFTCRIQIKIDRINSAFALLRYEVGSFDLCIEDESNVNLIQINTETREYLFTGCAGLFVGGTASFTTRGCTLTIQDNQPDRRVLIRVDTCQNRATGSVRLLAQGTTLTITDRNTNNNSCACN